MGWFDDVVDGVSGVFGGGTGSGGGWLDDIIGIGGALFDMYGTYQAGESAKDQGDKQAEIYERTAKANAKLSMFDAEVARLSGLGMEAKADYVAGQTYQKAQEILASQTARYAKSGVAVKTGTPLDVERETAREAASEIAMIKYNGQTAKQKALAEAEKYKLAAENGLYLGNLQATLAQIAAEDRAETYMWQNISGLFKNAYSLGKDSGWFETKKTA
jgi:hypothetical protein